MGKRKSTGKRLRFSIFKRDRFTCQYCGRTPPSIVLVVDHILPVAAGGQTVPTNLITSCEACNQGKSSELLSTIPESVDSALSKEVERHEQLHEFNKFLLKARRAINSAAKGLAEYWNTACDNPPGSLLDGSFQRELLATIKRFLGRLPATEIYDSIDIAVSRKPPQYNKEKTFKYFCGVCWSKIKERGHPQNAKS